MITSSGPFCDVCGHYIIDPTDHVNFFALNGQEGFCCHDKCKATVLAAGGDWTKLPDGPIRKAYEEKAREEATA